jgi:signal recognition particle subunit SRP54
MGPLESILGMIPGLGNLKELAQNKPDEKQLARVEAIISSMTPAERRNDQIINGSRRKRIAAGSGTSVEDVNRLLKQFGEMKKVLKMFGQGGSAAVRGMKGMPKIQPHEGFTPAPVPARNARRAAPGGLSNHDSQS